jgi:hypothetical protein
MAARDDLQDLNLFMENAVDQIGRAQRAGRHGHHGIAEFDRRIDEVFAAIVELRNEVRNALMRELAKPSKGPKKLPVL